MRNNIAFLSLMDSTLDMPISSVLAKSVERAGVGHALVGAVFLAATGITALMLPGEASAGAELGQWYVQPVFGLSELSTVSGNGGGLEPVGVGGASGPATATLDAGFNAGIALGRQLSDRWSVELLWEYRTNDSEVTLADGAQFNEGNYASSFVFINSLYRYPAGGPLVPFVGVGIGIAQEIDIDLEQDGVERSLSGSGDLAYQVFGGAAYSFTPQLEVLGTLRYGGASGIDLVSENFEGGTIQALDYDPVTVQVGLNYWY